MKSLATVLGAGLRISYVKSGQRLFFTQTAPRIVVGTDGSAREPLYTGAMNSLVSRIRRTGLVGAGAGIIGAPLLLHYIGSDAWSWASNLFFVGGGMCQYYS